MNKEFITIHEIADAIYRHPLMREIPFETIIGDTLELIQITGCPNLFDNKEAVLEVENWRTALPCDYYEINQMVLLSDNDDVIGTFKESTDVFSLEGSSDSSDLTYKIQGRVLYTSRKACKVLLSYKAILLDEEGFPLIINNASFIRALKSYIKMNWFTISFETGTIRGDVFQNAQQEYYANIAQAQNSLVMPDLAGMENIAIIMNDAMSRNFEYYNNFRDLNKSHQMRIH